MESLEPTSLKSTLNKSNNSICKKTKLTRSIMELKDSKKIDKIKNELFDF